LTNVNVRLRGWAVRARIVAFVATRRMATHDEEL